MPSSIWNKYKKLKEINNNSNIKTYLTRIEPIIKEIIPKNNNEYCIIKEKLENIKNKIYEIVEEDNKIYIVMENNKEIITEIDKILLSNEYIKKEGILYGQGKPITKKEIKELFKMEKSMCKIIYEKIEKDGIKEGKGTGFFCEIDNFPIKYALFTNNHVLDEYALKTKKTIYIEYYEDSKYKDKKIEINDKRRVFTNNELDYTFIEINELDNIKNYFKIDPILYINENNSLQNSDIFILQYPKGNELSFSYGKITSIEDNNIIHSASTEDGSSGSPIIRRSKDNYIIGLHNGTFKKDRYINSSNFGTLFDYILKDLNKQIKNNKKENKFNEIKRRIETQNNVKEAQSFDSIKRSMKHSINQNTLHSIRYKFLPKNIEKENQLSDDLTIQIKFKKNEDKLSEIKCIYYPKNNQKEIQLLHDYNLNISKWSEENKKSYLDAKEINKKLYENNIELYFNDKKIKFDYKLKVNAKREKKEINIRFKFKKNLTNMSYMFYNCSSLNSIDFSRFNTDKVTNMSWMLYNCSSLNSIDLSSFNTDNVINMNHMFYNCSSLKSIDLSSFYTDNVINMRYMFNNCSSLKSIDLCSFNTYNVTDMSGMFYNCSSLKSIGLSSFITYKVTNMSYMFNNCSSLKSINLSSFNTNNVTDMRGIFYNCSSLKTIDLSSFNSNNVTNMNGIFFNCSSLKKENIKINNKSDKLLNEII